MLSEPILKDLSRSSLIESSLNFDPVLSAIDDFESTNYEIQEELGRGSSGVVFRAKDRSANGSFALKLIRSPSNSENTPRLTREIENLIRLNHPNVVSIIDTGLIKDHVFLVMNFVDGCCLADLFSDSPSLMASYWLADLKNDWSRLATWGKEIASALEHLHSHDIFHGNLKPTNILVDREGKCLITDFGISSMIDHDFEGNHGGGVARFLRYRALEQLCGVVDERSDVYSLGRTLYELACIAGDLPSQSYNCVELPPICDLNPNVPADLGNVIDKACDKVAERRFQSVKELVAVLQRFLEGKSPCDRRRPGKRMSDQEFKALQKRKNRQVMLGTVGVFVLSFASVFAFNVVTNKSESNNTKLETTAELNASDPQEAPASDVNSKNNESIEATKETINPLVVENSQDSPNKQPKGEPAEPAAENFNQDPKPSDHDEQENVSQASSQNTQVKILALMTPLNSSGLSQGEKLQGKQTLERFATTVLSNKVSSEEAERLLAALFLGNTPKLEQMTEIQVPERAFASWLVLVQQTFEDRFQELDESPTSP